MNAQRKFVNFLKNAKRSKLAQENLENWNRVIATLKGI